MYVDGNICCTYSNVKKRKPKKKEKKKKQTSKKAIPENHTSYYSMHLLVLLFLQFLPDHGLTEVYYRGHQLLDDVPITLMVITNQ